MRLSVFGFILSLWLLAPTGQITAQQLSEQSVVSIFTMGPGDELFTKFGHSAIRVYDPLIGLDVIFDYGNFDFNEPNFYLKFAQGKLRYRLAADQYANFEYRYRYYNRSFIAQILNLSLEQRQDVFDFLQVNYQPENRYYLYDFFYDNCASRLKDVMVGALGDSVRFNTAPPDEPLSFRQLTDMYLDYSQWGDLGIDLCLGLPADKVATRLEYMFLPEFVLEGFEEAEVFRNGKWQPLVIDTHTVFEAERTERHDFFISPYLVFWLFALLAAAFTFMQWKGKSKNFKLDLALWLFIGLMGCVMLALWFLTDHNTTAKNMNLLWAWPSHLLMAWWLRSPKKARKIKGYFLANTVVCTALLITWPWLPQLLHGSMYPVVLVLALRSAYMYLSLKHVPSHQAVA